MNQTSSIFKRSSAWALAAGLAAIIALGVACGGDSGGNGGGGSDDGTITEAEASRAANNYFKTTLSLFTGNAKPQAFVDLFAPECREGVDTSGLTFIVMLIQSFAPELKDMKIEDVDLGGVNLTQTAEGTLITPKDVDAARVKVNGKFVPASEVFGDLGFDETEDTVAEPLLLVKRGGKVYIGDCTPLQDLSEGFGIAKEVAPAVRT